MTSPTAPPPGPEPPPGPGPTTPPSPGPPPPRQPARQGDVRPALAAAVVVLVGLAVALPVATPWSAPTTPASQAASGSTGPAERAAVARVDLGPGDFPAGWRVAPSVDPLAGILGSPGRGAGAGGATSPSRRRTMHRVAARYERCLGVGAADDAVFGASAPSPAARATSRAYTPQAGGPPLYAGSEAAAYRSGAPVAAAMHQIGSASFPKCLGAAIGRQAVVTGPATSGSSHVTYGTPTVQPLDLPRHRGVAAAGAAVMVPVTVGGSASAVQLEAVLVAGGHLEATLVTYAGPTGFPASLTRSLAGDLEDRVAGGGAAAGG